jgi:protein SCO1/2
MNQPAESSRARSGPRWLWGLLVLALVGLAAATLLFGRQARLVGGVQGGTGPKVAGANVLADYGTVPNFALVSQTGDTVRLADLHGQIWIADFIFTHCSSSCPMMSARMAKLATLLDPSWGVRLVSITVDPDRDTPAQLADYARVYSADPKHWLFLTGDKQQIRHLVKEGFHLAVDDASPEDAAKGAEPVLHSTRFVLVDGEGVLRAYYGALEEETLKTLARDIEKIRSGKNTARAS